MDVRADLGVAARVVPEEFVWVDSPVPGVTRMMLDRRGDEVAIATSLVRFAAGAVFPRHVHGLGEEFIVLDGDFRDASGCFLAGRYVRHPPDTEHAPWSVAGCVIFVKLRQFEPEDRAAVDVDLGRFAVAPPRGTSTHRLHAFGDEEVRLVRGRAGARMRLQPRPTLWELFVLDGTIEVAGVALPRWGWQRTPAGCALDVHFPDDADVWIKARPRPRTAASRGT